MTKSTSLAHTIDDFPRDLPAAMRAEVPGVLDEIIAELRHASPEYARIMDGSFGQELRDGVMQCLTTFVDVFADPSAPRDRRDEVCRQLGQYEAASGRTLDLLHAAYRLGCQVAWRRIMKLGERDNLDTALVSRLADAVFSYQDELAALSVQGYQAAQERSGDAREEWRGRLLRLIVEQPPPSRMELAGLAKRASWALPETVTPVALPGRAGVRAEGPHVPPLDDDILAGLTRAQPLLLVPGEVTPARERALVETVPGPAAIGLTVPLAEVADSLRWARQALALAESGHITPTVPVRCEDHLVTLWLHADPALAEHVVRRQLGVLERLTARQRGRYMETLSAWLESRCTAAEIAEKLHLHPQTIRYRIRQFEQTFGDRLNDPDTRFGLEVALRFTRLGQRAPRQRGAGAAQRGGSAAAARRQA